MRPHILLLTAALLASASAQADGPITRPVDLALILLTDVSKSVDNSEYAMVKEGYEKAFADPHVIAALMENSKGVAVAYVEFSGRDQFTVVQGWNVLSDAVTARAFGAAVAAAPRTSEGGTALALNLKKAANMLTTDAAGAGRRVIDVASDHPNDDGRSGPIRDAAVAAGITINALPIIEKNRMVPYDGHLTYAVQQWGFEDPVAFYRNHVIGGPGSFLIEVHDYAAFGEALKRKLLRELISSPGDDSSETFALAD